MRPCSSRESRSPRPPARGIAPRDDRRPGGAGAGRARRSRTRASSRCWTRWWTTCRRRRTCPPVSGHRPRRRPGARIRADRAGAVLGAGVQDHERPLRRAADLLPGLFGPGRQRARPSTTPPRASASASAACCRCTPTSARTSARSPAATSPRRWGCGSATTGDTLCDGRRPWSWMSMDFPPPVMSVAIEPKTQADQEKLARALEKLAAEDPSFRVSTDPETGQTLHLGDGRAAPRDHRRPTGARVQGRGPRGPASGRLPRDNHRARPSRRKTFVQETAGGASSLRSRCAWSRQAAGQGILFENALDGRHGAEGVRDRRRARRPRAAGARHHWPAIR